MKNSSLNSHWLPESEPSHVNFDFNFRPDYWVPADPLAVIIGNIVGELRRRVIEFSLRKGEGASLVLGPEDRDDFLSDERRAQLGSLHPCFTGGEYLPPYLVEEIEIGRFVLNTPTLDVVAFRVWREGGELNYRAVDEYGESLFFHPPLTSDHPLSFGELVEFIDSIQLYGAWKANDFVGQVFEFNVEGGVEPGTLSNFLKASSYRYPQLEAYYASRTRGWLQEHTQTGGESDLTPGN